MGMGRRIIVINQSFFISLPKIWLENMGLKKRDKIIMEINNEGHLILKPENKF